MGDSGSDTGPQTALIGREEGFWSTINAQPATVFTILKTVTRKSPKVGFVSLGCPKALVDSERILTRLRAEGYEVAASYGAADLVVVNTCGFIDAAGDESLDRIGA